VDRRRKPEHSRKLPEPRGLCGPPPRGDFFLWQAPASIHLEGIRQSLLVESVDGVACRLRIAAQLVSYLVGVLASVAGEEYLAEWRKVKASVEDASLPPGTHARRR
jgi:hypothetical protein